MKYMRVIAFFILAIICSTSYGHENKKCSLEQNQSLAASAQRKSKIYINPEHVMFRGKDMYVSLNQNWVQTSALFSDSEGMYIFDSQGGWTCGACNYYNTSSIWSCDRCGKRRNNLIEE
ncbi:MAG: hypothetical protein NTX49_01620 [Chlamydiae bacterium]|nr:hypothetical protein [Chlamydiota bacterium]